MDNPSQLPIEEFNAKRLAEINARSTIGYDDCLHWDESDPLQPLRDNFILPDDKVYLDGNSLGPPLQDHLTRIDSLLRQEWGAQLIQGWNDSGWYDAARRVGNRLAKLLGAESDTVLVTDSISVNLYKLAFAAVEHREDRSIVLIDKDIFPTDRYVVEGVCKTHGKRLRAVHHNRLAESLDSSVGLLIASHVDYRTGTILDLQRLTNRAHDAGTLVCWDLAHSAGAIPLQLETDRVDLAVGCGYKFLNGGPGSPGFLYVAPRLQSKLQSPIQGWFGHRAPFKFSEHYEPVDDVGRFLAGTPPILSLSALETALSIWDDVEMSAARGKAIALSECLIRLITDDEQLSEFVLASPRAHQQRGGQVTFSNSHAYPICQALIEAGVIGDFREPNLLRFGIAPLYLRFIDIWTAAQKLKQIMQEQAWQDPRFATRRSVT